MELLSLKLIHFKNYRNAEFSFNPYLNLITGNNGMGKTNILDAIYYLAFGKSYYSIPDKKLIRFDDFEDRNSFHRVEGKVTGTEKYHFTYSGARKKTVFRNNEPYEKISDHIGNIPVVSIFPEDIALVKGDSSLRRKFVDNTISQSDRMYLNHLMYYNKIIKRKNELLKQFSMNYRDKDILLDKYDRELKDPGEYIIIARKQFLDEFNLFFQKYYRLISGKMNEKVTIKHVRTVLPNEFSTIIFQTRQEDIRKKRSTMGPHREDFRIYINEKYAKYFASQGQQKSILFALKLAQFEYIKRILQKKPILLLDDFFEKLDENRIVNLMQLLKDSFFGQIFVTDTDPKRMEEIAKNIGFDFTTFTIEEGQLI